MKLKKKLGAALVAMAITTLCGVVPSAAMLNGSEALEDTAYDSQWGRMIRPPLVSVPEEPAIPDPDTVEHYYDFYTYADYPADDSIQTGIAFYQGKYNAAWAAYQVAEDYYERELRKSEMRAAAEMITMYREQLENPSWEIPGL